MHSSDEYIFDKNILSCEAWTQEELMTQSPTKGWLLSKFPHRTKIVITMTTSPDMVGRGPQNIVRGTSDSGTKFLNSINNYNFGTVRCNKEWVTDKASKILGTLTKVDKGWQKLTKVDKTLTKVDKGWWVTRLDNDLTWVREDEQKISW